jgi:hypothetical protein
MTFAFHHPKHYKKIKSVPKETIKEKTKTYSFNKPLIILGPPQPWQNIAKGYKEKLTEDLALQDSKYDRIDIDASDGHLNISVFGVKPKLGKYLFINNFWTLNTGRNQKQKRN